ncbi:MAG: sigma-70 family RNA polymerase sigma factor [Pseudomonadota bacterium]
MAQQARPRAAFSFDNSFLGEMSRLRRRLLWRTGSVEAAEDLLHDLWLRLKACSATDVAAPRAYMLRAADNLALDERRRRARYLLPAEADALTQLADESPTAEECIIARDELRVVIAAIADLPERRREIFLAARFSNECYASIAARYGVTTRTIENEVRRTLDHCADRLDRRAS